MYFHLVNEAVSLYRGGCNYILKGEPFLIEIGIVWVILPWKPLIYILLLLLLSLLLLLLLSLLLLLLLFMFICPLRVDLVEKRVRFPQSLSLVLNLYFRIFYFCIIELWVLVNLKYRKKQNKTKKTHAWSGALLVNAQVYPTHHKLQFRFFSFM